MKIYYVLGSMSELADPESKILQSVRQELLLFPTVEEATSLDSADVILIQEKVSFKNFRYINELLADPLIAKYYHKIFTINSDDCATGLLRGAYTSLPKSRFNPKLYTPVPYFDYPNELVFSKTQKEVLPTYLACWRGNTKSNKIRPVMAKALHGMSEVRIEMTDSWLDHQFKEKQAYVDLMLQSKFSLCPAGWASVSFRIYESMALGRCPVIIADNFVPPAGPNWKDFALFLPERDMPTLYSSIIQHEHSYKELGEQALQAWNEFFCPDKITRFYAQSLFSLLNYTPASSKEAELKRWESSDLYWSNKWTLSQRIVNKARRIFDKTM